MNLSGIRQTVFLDRYSLKNEKGEPVEKSPEKVFCSPATRFKPRHSIGGIKSFIRYYFQKFIMTYSLDFIHFFVFPLFCILKLCSPIFSVTAFPILFLVVLWNTILVFNIFILPCLLVV